MDNHQISVCIPRMNNDIKKSYIFKVFCNMKIGYIENINEIQLKGNPQFKRIIVRIKWNDSDCAKYILQRFEEGNNVKIVHSMPWYWICVQNRFSHINV